jgi:hypothetical protein
VLLALALALLECALPCPARTTFFGLFPRHAMGQAGLSRTDGMYIIYGQIQSTGTWGG